MSNLSLGERDAATIAQIGKLRFSPLSVVGGQGNRLIEEGGRSLLDLSGSAGPAVLGYCHPAIVSDGRDDRAQDRHQDRAIRFKSCLPPLSRPAANLKHASCGSATARRTSISDSSAAVFSLRS